MKIRTMTRVALFAALTAVGAFIRIPLGYSSITLQTFFTAMAGCVLGPWYGALSQLVYVALGLVFVQHLLHLQIQRPVICRQALGQVLMYGCRLLERFRLSLNLQANAGKCLHCPLDRPQSSE